MTQYQQFDCDLCGAGEAIELPHSRDYTGSGPIHICSRCGFVYVRERRSAKEIAQSWTESVFGSRYTARLPAIRARQVYVAEFADSVIGLKGQRLCDIGGGEGQFLDIVRGEPYRAAQVMGIEPSAANCKTLGEMGIDHFQGTIEEYAQSRRGAQRFDVVTIMWTLESCQSCRVMLNAAHDLLEDGGHVVVATGSRILVPFKKPLHYYLVKHPVDTHPFRFSANTLSAILAVTSFQTRTLNRYIDSDVLCAIARKVPRDQTVPWGGDPPQQVADFFERWHQDTQRHYAQA